MKNIFQKNSNVLPVLGSANGDQGFTLVEVMISLTIFSIIIVAGMGAILSAINQHYMAQNIRSAMDEMGFVMEDMSRNIRLGNTMHCFSASESGTGITGSSVATPEDCPLGFSSNKLVFNSSSGVPITYYIPASDKIQKINGTSTAVDMTTPDIQIDPTKSYFTVVGSAVGDGIQPIVNIRISGSVLYHGLPSNFSLETTVTQRQIDS